MRWDVREINPIRVSGEEHHGTTVLAETAEVRQQFSRNFFEKFLGDRLKRLTEEQKLTAHLLQTLR